MHNSGHWTEAACAVSQFEQHIRAITGLPLGDTRRHSDRVMENLIGDDIAKIPEILKETGAVVQLYGKAEAAWPQDGPCDADHETPLAINKCVISR